MNDTNTPQPESSSPRLILDSILLPTDFSPGSLVAFHHALKAALMAKSRFTILHVASEASEEWKDFPSVRGALERWGLIPPGSPHSAVPHLGIDVHKVSAREDSPVRSVIRYLERKPADFIVLATHPHEGRASWLRQSVAEPIARQAGQMTLFIPEGVSGFVSAADGSVALERILIPVAHTPRPEPALAAAARLVQSLKLARGTFVLLHVGEAGALADLPCPEVPGWEWRRESRSGEVIQGILDAAVQETAGLIVMATDGRHGFLDALRGSHSERVLHAATCPLLTIPEGSLAGGALSY